MVASLDRGDSALNWLRAHPVDVAIMDNEMPGLTGLEVAEHLAAEQIPSAVIIVSGRAGPADLRRALAVPVLVSALREYLVPGWLTRFATSTRGIAGSTPSSPHWPSLPRPIRCGNAKSTCCAWSPAE